MTQKIRKAYTATARCDLCVLLRQERAQILVLQA